MKGTIKKWITGRNYGFIETDEMDEDVFVYISAIGSEKQVSQGQNVEFEVERTSKGPRAKKVKLI
ncbi:MAG: cold shock domain-containing protein [Candidatus Korarchaeota archaeon]|nr:cold shock domain-containing protein [Candidatus Korarchaeota archaeon]NIU85292.1 cold shock domain-containing protein [Candidatus Thorarchaeota archaeon]NIW15391.1 cold shock domain-containing protein [Candidatus Thorarchaeota archaeon]NIW53336.1 cold shock domain-containing protein [Candidatus Korarchaeota archaeon]